MNLPPSLPKRVKKRVHSVKDMEAAAQEISVERTTEFKVSGEELISLSLNAAGLAAILPLVVTGIEADYSP